MPDTAVDGTFHVADTVQLPQSYKPVAASVMHAAWLLPVIPEIVATLRAPFPW